MRKVFILALAATLIFVFSSYALADTDFTDRLAGDDRIETSIEISEENFGDGDLDGGAVILCRSDLYPDALAAAALAGWFEAPILLNPPDSLNNDVEDELDRLFDGTDDGDTVYLIGGTGALSGKVEDDLEDLDLDVERISGDDRYDTAVEVANELADLIDDEDGGQINRIFIATGENWPDALSASGYSYCASACHGQDWDENGYDGDIPILLVREDDIPEPTEDWLNDNDDVDVFIVGGTGVVSNSVKDDIEDETSGDVERVSGSNRYETGLELILDDDLWSSDEQGLGFGDYGDWWNPDDGDFVPGFDDPDQVFVFATGQNWPDALSGSSLGMYGPLLLTSSINSDIEDYLQEMFDEAEEEDYGFGYVLGGEGVISEDTEDEIAELLSDGTF